MKAVSQLLFNDLGQLSAVNKNAQHGADENLKEVAQQFESLFTHMLLKNMRSASLGQGVFDNDQSKLYQDMFDQQLSTQLSQGRGLGIAELLVQQLGGHRIDQQSPLTMAGDAKPPLLINPTLSKAPESLKSPPVLENLMHQGPVNSDSPIRNPIDFVKKALPHAQRIGEVLGVAPRLILAQAALETGWGQKPIRNSDGSNSHNLFGIKASDNWTGSKAIVKTLEFVAGLGERVTDAFRSYQSMAESFDDYANLLKKSTRYKDALNTGEDSEAFATALKKGGYATDPEYINKIKRIADGSTLASAIKIAGSSHE